MLALLLLLAILGEFRSRTLIFNIEHKNVFFIIIIFKAVYLPQFKKKVLLGNLEDQKSPTLSIKL